MAKRIGYLTCIRRLQGTSSLFQKRSLTGDAVTTKQDETKQGTLIRRDGQFTYRILTNEHRDSALTVCARSFTREPSCKAINDFQPERKITFLDWIEYMDGWMDVVSTSGMSAVIIDEKAHKVVSACNVIDNSRVPYEYFERYKSDDKVLSPWVQLTDHLIEKSEKSNPEKIEPEKTAYVVFGGVLAEYASKGLGARVFADTVTLAEQKGYKHFMVIGSNIHSSNFASSLNFELLSEVNASEWKWNGVQVFKNIKSSHAIWKLWCKTFYA